ncbi:hypothetical protein SE17_33520, partial [Kouleothrix aurantiaca]
EFNGVDKTGTVAVASTGGWQTWATLSRSVTLSAGQQVMRVYVLGDDFNLNYLTFTTGAATPTNTPVATNTPTTPPAPTNTPTSGPTATPNPNGSNLALNKPISASTANSLYPATNANDGSLTTYWEGTAQPSTLTVDIGANANITSIVLKLNPDPAWATRTQTIQVLGHNQTTTTFSQLVAATTYTFNPSTGNTVTINVAATASAVRLNISSNSGAPAGQVAEFQVIGTMAPNPDLVVTGVSWTPSAPTETSAITLQATVQNAGDAASGATTVNFSVGGTAAGSANVGALAAGASQTVSLAIGTRGQGSYTVAATVDPGNVVIEKNDANNSFTSSTQMSVAQAPGPDLQVLSVTTNPPNPLAGNAVSFVVAVNNRGTTSVAAGTTTRVVIGSTTINNASTPAIATGAPVNVTVGTWTAVNGPNPA